MDLCDLLFLNICYWWFLYGFLMNMFVEYVIYIRVDEGFRGDFFFVGVVFVVFFLEFVKVLLVDNRCLFCLGFLFVVVK